MTEGKPKLVSVAPSPGFDIQTLLGPAAALEKLFQMFTVFNSRSDERSAFVNFFHNHWLWIAVGASLVVQLAVIYIPLMQQTFSTTPLNATNWLVCLGVASSVLWLGELSKIVIRRATR